MKITIDSNLINNKNNDEELKELEKFSKSGLFEIVGTQRLLDEMENYNPDAFEKAKSIKNISEPMIIGQWRVGKGYISSCDKLELKYENVAEVIFPNKSMEDLKINERNDIMHIISHYHSDSDIFLTRNTKDFFDGKKTNKNRHLEQKDRIRNWFESYGVIIKTPTEFINEIKKTVNNSKLKI